MILLLLKELVLMRDKNAFSMKLWKGGRINYLRVCALAGTYN